ncbi:MAG TPA: hypothetical protein PLM33_05955 [Acidobacteriota bacterium]|nr:hypothetical protein [Acidobacteriota bacterium]HRR25083.1 hypothetical protein [Acidobacteriota bacterium]
MKSSIRPGRSASSIGQGLELHGRMRHQIVVRAMHEWKIRPVSVPELARFMRHHVYRSLEDLGWIHTELADYLAEVLVRFAKTENLFPWSSVNRQRLAYLVDYLTEIAVQLEGGGSSLKQERALRQQVGDFSLFMSGIFRDFVKSKGILDFYLEEGSESYRRTAELKRRLLEPGAGRFDDLAEHFDRLSGALDYTCRVYFRSLGAKGKTPGV